jgi:hypothetical protein
MGYSGHFREAGEALPALSLFPIIVFIHKLTGVADTKAGSFQEEA